MGFNPECMLIAKILDTGDLKVVLDSGLEAQHFVDATCAEQFAYLVDYYTDREHPRSVPTREIFRTRFPRDFLPDDDPRTNIGELISAARNKQISVACKQWADELSIGADSGEGVATLEWIIASASMVIGRTKTCRDISLSSFTSSLLMDYDGAKDGRMRGIPWPWEKLNQLTQGIENGNLILLYGRPKNLKSWVALHLGMHFYRANSRGGKVLIFTMEMPPELVARRVAALATGVDYESFTQGKLSPTEEQAMRENLLELESTEVLDAVEGRRREFITTAPEDDMTVLQIGSKIETYNPDLVIVDGVYLLSDQRTKKGGVDWQVLANVSRDLKLLAKRRNVPIIGVHQANRKGDDTTDDLSDVAFTDNFARDADVLIKCIKIDSFNMGTVIALYFSGAREFKLAGFYIHGKPASNFDYIGSFESKEELLAYIAKSKKSQEKTATSPTNGMPNVADLMKGLKGKSNKNAAGGTPKV